MSSVFDLIGKYDNLNDPVPTLNTRPAVYGIVITFLVSCPSARGNDIFVGKANVRSKGYFVGMCVCTVIHEVYDSQMSWLG